MNISSDTKLTCKMLDIDKYYLIQRSDMAPVVGILEEATILHFKFKAIVNNYRFTYEDILIPTIDITTDECVISRLLNQETIKNVIDDVLVAFDNRFTKVKDVVEVWLEHIALDTPFSGNKIDCEYTYKNTTISISQTDCSILILVNNDELFNITPNNIKVCNININTNDITIGEFTMLKDRLHEALQN